jgi:hypothetical protein
MIFKYFRSWKRKLSNKIKKHPFKNTLIILIAPILIYFVANIILEFSKFATIGYILICIYGFVHILDKPLNILLWGASYVIGAIAISLLFNKLIPAISEKTFTSIFTGIILLSIIILLFLQSRKLRKIKKRKKNYSK